MMKKIAFRLDAGKSIGSGHFIRCTALADALSVILDCEIIFICRNEMTELCKYPIVYINKAYETNQAVYEFPSIIDEIGEIESILKGKKIDCLIVDHYGAGNNYFEKLYRKVQCLICIDDSLHRFVQADVIVNGNIYGYKAKYTGAKQQLIGSEYMLMREMFQHMPKRGNNNEVHNVFITSGGADPCRFCVKISEELIKDFKNINFSVIVGNDFSQDYIEELENIKVDLYRNANMKECMCKSDFFISGAGSTLYELAACGVPSISYILAEDQRLVAEYMNKIGTTHLGGDFQFFDDKKFFHACAELFESKVKRDSMSRIGQETIDGMGAKKVAAKIVQFLSTQK